MVWPQSVSMLQLGIFAAVMTAGAAALIRTFLRTREVGGAARRSSLSTAGIALQAAGFAAAGFGPIRPTLPWLSATSLVDTALVALLGGMALALFIASAAAMGKNWSVVARTRSDHQLVRTGPFATVRHPIYLALLFYLLSLGLAFGHWLNFVVAVPLYLAGTAIRIREEERLLRDRFGQDHADYVRDVSAIIPRLF